MRKMQIKKEKTGHSARSVIPHTESVTTHALGTRNRPTRAENSANTSPRVKPT